jgi:hypothetical protein
MDNAKAKNSADIIRAYLKLGLTVFVPLSSFTNKLQSSENHRKSCYQMECEKTDIQLCEKLLPPEMRVCYIHIVSVRKILQSYQIIKTCKLLYKNLSIGYIRDSESVRANA